ncbi:MAG: DUF5110 domain-containing protein [Phycisphaerales bacterium]|nr:DUF5110 domain-containing protein [Phycisphaerales bacterium]
MQTLRYLTMTIVSILGSSPSLGGEILLAPIANDDATIKSGHARFTILTPEMIRMEWSPSNSFEDRASFTFINRNLKVPKYNTSRDGEWLVITTDALTLRYQDDGQPFRDGNLSITFKLNGQSVEWKPGMDESGNLRGTTRTLDGVSGACPLEKGILSRDGWSVVDDSTRLLFANDPPHWVEQRKDANALDWYFFGYGHNYKQALKDYTKVAGSIPVPPRYAFGTWWSRYWAYSDAELRTLIKEFNEHDVPLDVLVIDMDWHLDGWTGYTWNPKYFPDPDGFLKWVHEQGLRTTLNLHPHSGVGKHEAAFPEVATAMGLSPETTDSIPFDCTDPKYMNAYFKYLHHPKERQGIDFWWMDWQQGEETKIPGLDPLFWLNHLHWIDMAANPDRAGKRPLVFSRWGGLGNHRYQVGFSGDTFCNWASLAFQPYFTATAGNVGYAYWSHDIGGHQPGKVNPELYTRWVQFGVFSPILRTHTSKNEAAERRIWMFPPENFKAMREAFRFRYELIPYIYTMARKCHDTALPLCRPLYYEWPELDEAYNHPGQYMFGDDLLVAPITQPANSITGYAHQKVWLPPGRWINWFTDDIHDGPKTVLVQAGLDEIPLFARAGAIIPTAPPALRTQSISDDTITLHVFPGESGEAVLYEDDGMSANYDNGGTRTRITSEYVGENYTVTIHPATGELAPNAPPRAYEVRLHVLYPAFPSFEGAIRIDGENIDEAQQPNTAGWRKDVDQLQLVISTSPIERTEACSIVINLDGPYSENPWNARGLRGRMRALEEVEALLEIDDRQILGTKNIKEDWANGVSFDKTVTASLLAWMQAIREVNESTADEQTKRKCYCRLLGLVPYVHPSSKDSTATHCTLEVSTDLTSQTLTDVKEWSASFNLEPPKNWRTLDAGTTGKVRAKVGETIGQRIELEREGPLQSTILRGDMIVEIPDIATIGIPISTTLFPSINRWHLLGPFDAPDAERLQTVFAPEQRIDLAATYTGKDNKTIRWQKIERPVTPDSDLTDEFFVEFHKYFGDYHYNAVAYALTYLHAPRDMDVVLAIGSDDGVAVWLNGDEVYRHDVGRPFTSKQDRVKVSLKKGSNAMLLKISQGGGMWGFSTHVETEDGQLAEEVTSHLQP